MADGARAPAEAGGAGRAAEDEGMTRRSSIGRLAPAAALAAALALPPGVQASADERDRQNFAGWASAMISCSFTPPTPIAEAICRETVRLAQAQAARGGFEVSEPRDATDYGLAADFGLPLIQVLIGAPAGGSRVSALHVTMRAVVIHSGPVGVLGEEVPGAPTAGVWATRTGTLVLWERAGTWLVPSDPAAAVRQVGPALAEAMQTLFVAIYEARSPEPPPPPPPQMQPLPLPQVQPQAQPPPRRRGT
jgi:hypothetical protein